MICKNCNTPIDDPSRPDQQFHNRKCFAEYRTKNPRQKLPNIIPSPSHDLPKLLADLTLGDIMRISAENVRLKDVERKYTELIIKIKYLVPKDDLDQDYLFIGEDGSKMKSTDGRKLPDSIKNNETIKAEGIPSVLRGRKPKKPSEELISDCPKSNIPEVKIKVEKVLPEEEEFVIPKFSEVD